MREIGLEVWVASETMHWQKPICEVAVRHWLDFGSAEVWDWHCPGSSTIHTHILHVTCSVVFGEQVDWSVWWWMRRMGLHH